MEAFTFTHVCVDSSQTVLAPQTLVQFSYHQRKINRNERAPEILYPIHT